MENLITVKDKNFKPYLPHEQIQERIKALAAAINDDYQGKEPIFIGILNGAFMFAADLYREVTLPGEITFIKVRSYVKDKSSGKVNTVLGLDVELEDRHLVIVEDIVDTGLTMQHLLSDLSLLKPASIQIATLFVKSDALKVPLNLKYVGFDVPDLFIVGYGLDYDGYGRNLKDVYQINE